jgi:hypothetical protein
MSTVLFGHKKAPFTGLLGVVFRQQLLFDSG